MIQDEKRRMCLDFYIHYPTRSFIEVKVHGDAYGCLSQIQRYFNYFKGEVVPILVAPKNIIYDLQEINSDEFPICLIEIDPEDPGAGAKVAKDISNRIIHKNFPFDQVGIWQEDFEFEKSKKDIEKSQEKIGKLDNVLLSFKPLIEIDNFKILEDEISYFNMEYEIGHLTAAALRLGRTLEFIFYALARSWGVNINKLTIKKIQILRELFSNLEKQIINYHIVEDIDKSHYQNILREKSQKIMKKMNNLILDIDDNKIKEVDVPLNLPSILSDMKKHFKDQESIIQEFNLIEKEKLLRKILNKRNLAAHADTSGKRQEFEEEELLNMVENLREILFHLCNIASIAQKLKT
tara:strand:+ start:643 stop:1692 length:1050 start_codon:yes stop_codon:yes gene_type:complete